MNLLALNEAYERVRRRTTSQIEKLYEAHCVKCGEPVVMACFVRQGEDFTEVRYPGPPVLRAPLRDRLHAKGGCGMARGLEEEDVETSGARRSPPTCTPDGAAVQEKR